MNVNYYIVNMEFKCNYFSHGTKCAGVALAAMNTVCAVGSAYEASLAGKLRL